MHGELDSRAPTGAVETPVGAARDCPPQAKPWEVLLETPNKPENADKSNVENSPKTGDTTNEIKREREGKEKIIADKKTGLEICNGKNSDEAGKDNDNGEQTRDVTESGIDMGKEEDIRQGGAVYGEGQGGAVYGGGREKGGIGGTRKEAENGGQNRTLPKGEHPMHEDESSHATTGGVPTPPGAASSCSLLGKSLGSLPTPQSVDQADSPSTETARKPVISVRKIEPLMEIKEDGLNFAKSAPLATQIRLSTQQAMTRRQEKHCWTPARARRS